MSDKFLRVVVAHRPPFVFVANSTGNAFYYGLLIDLLNKILATSNETLAYNIYVSPANAGGSLSATGWNGIVGELAYGRADVALFPLTRTTARLTAIDCTFSYLDQGVGLATLNINKGSGPLSVLAPFEMRLWVTLLFTVIGVAFVFWGLDVWSRRVRSRQLAAFQQAGSISAQEAERARRKDEQNTVLISFMAAAGAPERPNRASGAVQVLYIVYCFFCLIVLSSYTANLTSFLSVQKTSVEISGIQDLVDRQLSLAVIPNGTNAAYFTSSYDPLALQLKDNLRYCDTDTCIRWLREGRVAAFASDQPQLAYLAALQPCDLEVVGNAFGPGNLVIGLQRGSPLLPLFNDALQRFAEDGTLSALRRAWFEGLSQCGSPGSGATLANRRLGLGQMLGAFVLLAAGVLLAFSVGTVENLKWCLARAYARSYGDLAIQRNESEEGGPSSALSAGLRRQWRRASMQLMSMVHPPPQDGSAHSAADGPDGGGSAGSGAAGDAAGAGDYGYASLSGQGTPCETFRESPALHTGALGTPPSGAVEVYGYAAAAGSGAAAAAKGFAEVKPGGGSDGVKPLPAAPLGSNQTRASAAAAGLHSRFWTQRFPSSTATAATTANMATATTAETVTMVAMAPPGAASWVSQPARLLSTGAACNVAASAATTNTTGDQAGWRDPSRSNGNAPSPSVPPAQKGWSREEPGIHSARGPTSSTSAAPPLPSLPPHPPLYSSYDTYDTDSCSGSGMEEPVAAAMAVGEEQASVASITHVCLQQRSASGLRRGRKGP